ncbi:hypothetical protein [Rhizobium sp. C4]|uniref:hypothetical protein n=1 Tax=Rhizobium sp. C4 TaxID=1349800 RepID=UPI001E2FA9CB|nr:hypothetical protein [Rhizobium sp. C4]MCD2175318.1 hypothetical protein [Rhizobium sp. C4]
MFLLRGQTAGLNSLKICVLRLQLETLLQDRRRFHCSQDRCDPAVDRELGRLMAGRCADDHLLNQHPDHRYVLLLQVLVGGVAHVIEHRIDDQFDILGR